LPQSKMSTSNGFTPSQSGDFCAAAILEAFHEYSSRFDVITRRAKDRFRDRNWHGLRSDSDERLDLYKEAIDRIVAEVKRLLGAGVSDKGVWEGIKAAYSASIDKLDMWELAETFFNSVTRRIFSTIGVDPEIEFIDTCTRTELPVAHEHLYHTHAGNRETRVLIEEILGEFENPTAYEDMSRDARGAAEIIDAKLRAGGHDGAIDRAEMLRSVFYRGKGAYIIGRVFVGNALYPLVLALLNGPSGMRVDAVLLSEDEVSILFSFTRSYFHVEVKQPLELVSFLKTIIPLKRVAEIYIAIGYNKHGKSELYCDLLRHLGRTSGKFEIARGARGMVMEVFTMPDYDLVFKVIKDRFAYPKNSTREAVRAKYGLVFKHDRAGRLVDAQEYEHLRFSRDRFSDDLLESLTRNAAKNVMVGENHVVIRHVYVERRVTPLNIYIKEASEEEASSAIMDYGSAIKDMASTNIFPGDILLKNFGVTRHGRVVFYDYDELSLLTECRFRVIPPPRTYEEELSDEPWFVVERNEVFPEELGRFLGLTGRLRDLFLEHHSDLFEVELWRRTQNRIREGEIIDIYPYSQGSRLGGRYTG
jgi:isocitrate dehydrogenase kinase/phosphatase